MVVVLVGSVMRIAVCGIVALLGGSLVTLAQLPVLSRPQLPDSGLLQRMGLRQRWTTVVPVDGTRDRVDYAQVFGTQVLIQNTSGLVTALDGETGRRQWTITLGQPYRSQHLPAAANKHTFCILSGLTVYGIDRQTGLVAWSMRSPGIPSAPIGMDETRFYLATTDGEVYAYVLPLSARAFTEQFGGQEKGTGDYQSADPVTNPASLRTPFKLWDFQTNYQVVQAPVPLSTHVVFANRAGVLYSFQRDVNQLADRFYSQAPITAPISHVGDDIYVASQDYSVYNFEVTGGQLGQRWQTTIHSRILEKPIVVGPEVYVVGLDQGMFCLDRGDGSIRWRQTDAAQFLAASKRLVFAADRYGNTLCLDRAKGRVLHSWNSRGWGHRVVNEETDRLYLVNHDGLVICLHDLDREYAQPYFHNARPAPQAKPARQADRAGADEAEPGDQ
jgi:outer membrane protein assembly factor BamB